MATTGPLAMYLTRHHPACLHGVESLPDHGHHGPTGHVLDQAGEEGLGREVSIVLLQVSNTCLFHLHSDQLEALVLKSLDNLSHNSPLDAIGLDHDEGSLVITHGGGL